jgi:hypothetical protein
MKRFASAISPLRVLGEPGMGGIAIEPLPIEPLPLKTAGDGTPISPRHRSEQLRYRRACGGLDPAEPDLNQTASRSGRSRPSAWSVSDSETHRCVVKVGGG